VGLEETIDTPEGEVLVWTGKIKINLEGDSNIGKIVSFEDKWY
jgi:hypothetical protein